MNPRHSQHVLSTMTARLYLTVHQENCVKKFW